MADVCRLVRVGGGVFDERATEGDGVAGRRQHRHVHVECQRGVENRGGPASVVEVGVDVARRRRRPLVHPVEVAGTQRGGEILGDRHRRLAQYPRTAQCRGCRPIAELGLCRCLKRRLDVVAHANAVEGVAYGGGQLSPNVEHVRQAYPDRRLMPPRAGFEARDRIPL